MSHSQRRPIINVMAMTESGPMFLGAINTEGKNKTKEFIRDILLEATGEIGP